VPVSQLVVSGLLIGAIYALIAVGVNLVFGVLRLINFAHGEFVMLAMYLTFYLHHWWGIDPFVSVLITAPCGFVFAALTYVLVLKPVMRQSFFVQLFATLGVSILITNLTLYLLSGTYRTVTTAYTGSTLSVFGTLVSVTRLVAFVVAIATATGLFLYLRHSEGGRMIRATAQDPAAAATLGINTDRVYLLTFAVGGMLAGCAGSLLAPISPIYPSVGEQLILVSFVVVILGGLGSFVGAVTGGLLVGVVETFTGYIAGEAVRQVGYFVVLLVILLLRPAGLFGTRGAEEYRVV
jgi:branched-chain amino acid transport system permease protein